MGKGYNNFMSKKAFHPGSQANQKRVQEAEAKAAAKQKHDEETLAQYLREQELLDQKSLVSKQSKEKLSLNFMYEAPPGVEKPTKQQNEKVEFKDSAGKTVASSSKVPELQLEWKRSKPLKKDTTATTTASTTTPIKVEKNDHHHQLIKKEQQKIIKRESDSYDRSKLKKIKSE